MTISALVPYRDKRLTGPFMKCLKDNYEWVRRQAAQGLGNQGEKKAVPALIAALNDVDRFVVLDVITALGKIGDSRAVAPVRALLNREREKGEAGDGDVIKAAEETIRKCGG